MMAKTEKRKQDTKKFSFILLIGLLLAVGYFAISIINVNMDIKSRKKEVAKLNAQYEEQLAENAQLQAVADGGNKDEYVEKVAREKLGYVKPGEKVYYNITPGNWFLLDMEET